MTTERLQQIYEEAERKAKSGVGAYAIQPETVIALVVAARRDVATFAQTSAVLRMRQGLEDVMEADNSHESVTWGIADKALADAEKMIGYA